VSPGAQYKLPVLEIGKMGIITTTKRKMNISTTLEHDQMLKKKTLNGYQLMEHLESHSKM
jgi:hypothetical protein